MKLLTINQTTAIRFGLPPLPVVKNIDFSNGSEIDEVNFLPFKIEFFKDKVSFYHDLNFNYGIYGLGEAIGPLNRRGKIYRTYNIDTSEHCPSLQSMYGSHPFLIFDGEEKFGLFIDCPSEIVFDLGFTNKELAKISVLSRNFDVYFIKGKDLLDIVKEYLKLFDKPFVPPKWAFGYQQSRWSYPNKEEVLRVADTFREKSIPCDAIYLDIDYMDDYKIFTTSDERFSDFETFVESLKRKGFNVIPIIDPGVKIEKDYHVYESGLKNDVFCKTKDGREFVAAVWPGWVHFPDFMSPRVREWWGKLYTRFVEMGINSFWNDMNEPSIFYTPETLEATLSSLEKLKLSSGIETLIKLYELQKQFNGEHIYRHFYHLDGTLLHNDVHNLYGFFMAKATADGLKSLSEKRYFLISRSTYSGAHSFTGLWTGDNKSWWEHLEANIHMLMSLNMVGFFYNGADIGGFGDNANSELLIRWTQLGIFSPLFRNHSAIDTRRQEPWAFDSQTESIVKNAIKARYSFLSHIYSQFMLSVFNLKPLIRPIFFDYKDENSREIEDQFMFGDSIMVVPVYKPQLKKRFVYLPEDDWLMWKMSDIENRNFEILSPGVHLIDVALEEIPIFIKKNSMFVLNEPMNYVGEREISELTVVGFIDDEAVLVHYEDNGLDYSFETGDYSKLLLRLKKNGNSYDLDINTQGSYVSSVKKLNFEIYDSSGKLHKFEKIL